MAAPTLAQLQNALPVDAEIELEVPLDSLVRHPRNPRKGRREKIRKSIEEHGFADVVIAQRSTRHVIAGWHRSDVARELGYTHAPIVIWRDVDDEEALRQVLDYNKSSDDAEYELTVLRDVLTDLEASTSGLTGTLYDSDDLAAITRSLQLTTTSFDDLASTPKDPDAQHDPVTGGAVTRDEFRQLALFFETEDERREVVSALRTLRDEHGLDNDAQALLHLVRQ